MLLVGCHRTPVATQVQPPAATSLRDQETKLASQSFAQGDWASEAAHIRRALAADPSDTSLKIMLATTLNRQGKYQEAISVSREAEKTATDPGLKRTAGKYAVYLQQKHGHNVSPRS